MSSTSYVLTNYDPGIRCGCRANAYAWEFCPEHKAIEEARHKAVLEFHRTDAIEREKDWLTE